VVTWSDPPSPFLLPGVWEKVNCKAVSNIVLGIVIIDNSKR
jgi:hypothetical protein